MTDEATKQLADLVMTCAYAIISGAETVTLSIRGSRPPGFPRGELLSVGASGAKNYAVDPLKALAWIQSKTRAAAPTQAPATKAKP